jgi:hypothetical protein
MVISPSKELVDFNTTTQLPIKLNSLIMSLNECLTSVAKGSDTVAKCLQNIRSIFEELSLIGHVVDDIDLVIYAYIKLIKINN